MAMLEKLNKPLVNIVALDSCRADYFLEIAENPNIHYIFSSLHMNGLWQKGDKASIDQDTYFKINAWLKENTVHEIVTPGGSAANTLTTALRALKGTPHSAKLTFICTIGDRTNGLLIKKKFAEYGDIEIFPALPKKQQEEVVTAVSYIFIDVEDGVTEKYIAKNAGYGNRELITEKHVRELFAREKFDIAFLYGISKFTGEVVAAFKEEALKTKAQIFFPLPSEIENEGIRKLALDIVENDAAVVFGNMDELCNVFGLERKFEADREKALELLKKKLAKRNASAFISNSVHGSIAITPSGITKRPVWEKLNMVKDPTGAGDSFNAGVVTSFILGGTVQDAQSLGALFANRTLQQIGAQLPGNLPAELREMVIATA